MYDKDGGIHVMNNLQRIEFVEVKGLFGACVTHFPRMQQKIFHKI
jgi:hypothetical protein